MRDHTLVPSANSSRSVLSSSSNKSEELYLDQMQRESNKIDQDEPVAIFDSIQLEYMTLERQNHSVSKAVDTPSNMRTKHMQNIAPSLVNNIAENNNDIINIQLNYDINWALDQDLWNGKFRAIFLHGLIEHLGSNIRNIKKSLFRMEKYILSKCIDGSKANNIKDLEGLGKAVWGFISALYTSQWDNLMVNSTNRLFRNNFKLKFSPQVVKETTKSKETNMANTSYISSLLPPILAKLAKEVNEISKYFKKQQPANSWKKLMYKYLLNCLTLLTL